MKNLLGIIDLKSLENYEYKDKIILAFTKLSINPKKITDEEINEYFKDIENDEIKSKHIEKLKEMLGK